MHINCGGEKSTIGNVIYEGDQYEGGAAKFHPMIDYWGFSSTGHFWDHNRTINDYIAQNVSVLGMNHSGCTPEHDFLLYLLLTMGAA